MINRFYIVLRGYFPGLAATVHCLGWLNSIDQLGIKATVVNLRSDDDASRMPNIYNNIDILNIWEERKVRSSKNRYVRFLQHMYNAWQFSSKLGPGDIVWVYDCPEIMPILTKVKGVRVYAEVTEHPSMSEQNPIIRLMKCSIKKSFKKLDGLFVITKSLRNAYIERGIEPKRIHVINMIVDSSRFEGLVKDWEEPYIAYCGNGANNKDGVDQLIKSFAIVMDKYPYYKLYIIGPPAKKGDGSGNVELIEELGIKDNVVFLGCKPMEAVPQLLVNASILALNRPDSIQAQYGFPSKLGEYLLTGNPVVVTDVGDIPLFVKDKENAMLARHDNVCDFADNIIWLIEHPAESQQIGMRGKMLALKSFNPITEVIKMLTVMEIPYKQVQ